MQTRLFQFPAALLLLAATTAVSHADTTTPVSGAAYAFGLGTSGQLGNGTTNSASSPAAVGTPLTSGVTAVAGSAEDGFALRNGAA